MISLGFTGRKHSRESKIKMSLSHKGKKHSEEHRKRIAESNKKRGELRRVTLVCERCKKIFKVEFSKRNRKFCSVACANRIPWNKGIPATKEWRRKQSLIMRGRIPWNLGIPNSKETRSKISLAIRNKMKDPEYRLKVRNNFKKLVKLGRVYSGPNYSERVLGKVLNKLFPKEWKYVGDGKFWIGYKCPDFVNVNGKKKVIELFGNIWHDKKDEFLRSKHFKKFGFDTLVIWVKDLKKHREYVEKKLIDFCEL